MAHFYGGISGSRGPATRMGTKDSGFDCYAQGYGSRISVSFHHNRETEHDDASVMIGGGYTSHARGRAIYLPDVDAIVQALDSGDPKIARIWDRIQAEFDKLVSEAPTAIVRQERKREREVREEKRLQKRLEAERKQIIATLDGTEKLRLTKLLDAEWDSEGNPMAMHIFGPDYGNLRYDEDGETVLVEAKLPGFKRTWQRFTFDVSTGQWVLPFDADDIGVEDCINDSGYGWRVVEASA
jgi:hypothetical protein